LKAESLYRAGRTSEALAAVTEAEGLAERSEEKTLRAVLHRLRGVFLAALGGKETQIEASFRAAISIANEQKAVPLEKSAAKIYAEYRRRKALGEHGFRLPLS
jgi:hypothetical protein